MDRERGRQLALGCGSLLGASVLGVFPVLLLVLPTATLSGSVGESERMVDADAVKKEMAELEPMMGGVAAAPAAPPAMTRGPMVRPLPSPRPVAQQNRMEDVAFPEAEAEVAPEPGGAGSEEGGVRQWFPESLLWAPRVQTDAQGQASLDVTVPDQLTTWRLLGLAHDLDGYQSGAVHTFDARLPLVVEPVVPGWLYAGDRLHAPVQVVNMTPNSVTGRLNVQAEGALLGRADGTVALGSQGSAVRFVELRADRTGTGQVSGSWTSAAGEDQAIRSVPVLAAGRPVHTRRSGTVATSRALSLDEVPGSDPATRALSVRVFPGPLAVLQSELERVGSGQFLPAEEAYGFALAARFAELGARTGVEIPSQAVRKLQILAWQRIARSAQIPSPAQAADLLHALDGVKDHELVEALRPRLVSTLTAGQRGDGTWSRRASATLQEVLVHTAISARALPESERGALLKASGAIERYQGQIDDPYTASVILAAGLADGALKAKLTERVVQAVQTAPDGTIQIALPPGIVGIWGRTPSRAEVLAWAALAVEDPQLGGDLVAQLMSGYSDQRGLGAGRANPAALDALIRWMPALDQPVEVVLRRGDRELARAAVDPSQPRVPAVLLVEAPSSTDDLSLQVEPSSPGLAFVAELTSYVPWSDRDQLPGVEVQTQVSSMAVGREGTVTLAVSAPSGESLTLEQGIPAGATVDESRLMAQRRAGVLEDYQIHTDRVRLTTRRFGAGEVLELQIDVQPAFAGRFRTVPLVVERRDGGRTPLPPHVWEVGTGEGS